MNNNERASNVVFNAYQLYSGKPHSLQDDPFSMYSYDRPSNCFWAGVSEYLFETGKSEQEVKEFLASKDTRWLLDLYDDEVHNIGKQLVKKYLGE